jgi:RNA polymerase sigma-70 factor (ECF subfamily)
MARLALRLSGPAEWEEVLQEALTLAWRKRDRFDPARGGARTWLLALTADRARKAHRHARPATAQLDDVADAQTADIARDVDLDRAIAGLSVRQRCVVELYYFLDLPVADVAAVMACSPGTVKSTLSDARSRLRAALEVRAND